MAKIETPFGKIIFTCNLMLVWLWIMVKINTRMQYSWWNLIKINNQKEGNNFQTRKWLFCFYVHSSCKIVHCTNIMIIKMSESVKKVINNPNFHVLNAVWHLGKLQKIIKVWEPIHNVWFFFFFSPKTCRSWHQ